MMPRTLKDWLLCAIYAVLLGTMLGADVAVASHLEGWLDNADQFAAQQRQSAVSQAATMRNAEKATAYAAEAAGYARDAMRYAPQAAKNAQLATKNAASATADAAAITAQARADAPYIEGGMIQLWQHTDNAVAHVDRATGQGEAQQTAIAGETVATLQASHEVVVNLQAITADGKEAADYEKKQITTPLTKMQRLGRSLEDFGAMVLGHLL